jgi:hypothetical protein
VGINSPLKEVDMVSFFSKIKILEMGKIYGNPNPQRKITKISDFCFRKKKGP